jgi:hypothetical protein
LRLKLSRETTWFKIGWVRKMERIIFCKNFSIILKMNEKINIIDDLEIEFKKMYNECKKKYSTTREVNKSLNKGIEAGLKLLASIKTSHPTTPENGNHLINP